MMDERPDTITELPKKHYDAQNHGAIIMYLHNYPVICERVARDLGWQPGDGTVEMWFNNFIFQCHLADQPGGKKSGAKDARIFLKTAFNTVDTVPKMLDKIQAEIPDVPKMAIYVNPDD